MNFRLLYSSARVIRLTDADRQLRLAESMGAHMAEEHAMSHMAGRVFGALFISDSPEQSIDELAASLRASRGAISMATKELLRTRVIEKRGRAGERRQYYRLRPHLWSRLYLERTSNLEEHVRMAEEGLEMMRGEPTEAMERLMEMAAFFRFLQEIMPEAATRWRTRGPELMAELAERFQERDD